jgi:hypothetical protein
LDVYLSPSIGHQASRLPFSFLLEKAFYFFIFIFSFSLNLNLKDLFHRLSYGKEREGLIIKR